MTEGRSKHTERVSNLTEGEIVDAINLFGGDIRAAAQQLNVTPSGLSTRVYSDNKLRALFITDIARLEGVEPDEVEAVMKAAGVVLPKDSAKDGESMMTKALEVQNLDLIADGLERNGIKKETVDKLKGLGKVETNPALFLVASLDMRQLMVVFSGAALMEMAETIKDNYLDPTKPIPLKERAVWQRLYNQIVDQMGRSYDRVLAGTTAMVKLTSPGNKKGKPAKAGFKPLSERRGDQ